MNALYNNQYDIFFLILRRQHTETSSDALHKLPGLQLLRPKARSTGMTLEDKI